MFFDELVKQTLQTEEITSPRLVIERANTLKFINESSFSHKKKGASQRYRSNRKEAFSEGHKIKRETTNGRSVE